MTEPTTPSGDTADAAPDVAGAEGNGYEGSGAWGTWALGLLLVLFLLAAGATVHSIVITFTG